MKYPTTSFELPKLALKELEPIIRNGRHLATGRPFKEFGGMRSRGDSSQLADLCCDQLSKGAERLTFSSDPIGGDGILYDSDTGYAFPTEHVFVPPSKNASGNIEQLILDKIAQKQSKGDEAYASGKILIVFLGSGGGAWYPDMLSKRLPEDMDFEAIWVVGLLEAVGGAYTYAATRVDGLGTTPKWRIRITRGFDDRSVKSVRAA